MELFAGILLLASTLSGAATPPVGDEFEAFKGWYIRKGATAEVRDGKLYYQASFKGLNVLAKTFILAPDAYPFFEIKIDEAKSIYNIRLQDEGGKPKQFKRGSSTGVFRGTYPIGGDKPRKLRLSVNNPEGAEMVIDYVRFIPRASQEKPTPADAAKVALPAFDGSFYENDRAWFLQNDRLAAAVFKKTGALAGLWNRKTGARVMRYSADRYLLQTAANEFANNENGDAVFGKATLATEDDGPRLEIQARNRGFPNLNLTVTKTYTLRDNVLAKQAAFAADVDSNGFIRVLSVANLAPAFRAPGYMNSPLRHPQDYPYIYAHDIKEDTYQNMYAGRADYHLVCFVNLEAGYGLGHYRQAINGRWVHPLTADSDRPSLCYTATGWRFMGLTERLAPQTPASFTAHFRVFEGGQVAFHRQFMAQPAFQATYDDSMPSWGREVKAVGLVPGSPMTPIYYEKGAEVIEDGYIIATPNTMRRAAQGDVWQAFHQDGSLLNSAIDESIYAPRLHAINQISPKIKLAPFTWAWSFTTEGDFFTAHPDCTFFDAKGQPISGDGERHSTRMTPEAREWILQRYREWFREFKWPILYIDGGQGGISQVDWKSMTAMQPYEWMDFHRGLRSVIKEFGDDRALFMNGTCGLYSLFNHFGYFEGLMATRDWRALADRLFMVKLYEHGDWWTSPLYFRRDRMQPYFNYVVGLGLKPTCTVAPASLQLIETAYEMKDAELYEFDVTPCWWKEQTEIEAYGLRLGDSALISLTNQEKKARTARIGFNRDKLNLDAGRKVFIYQLTPNKLADGFNNILTEKGLRALYRQSGWALSDFADLRLLTMENAAPGRRELDVSLPSKRVSLLLITQSPALVYSVSDQPTNLELPETLGVKITGNHDADRRVARMTVTAEKPCETMAPVPNAATATVNDKPVKVRMVALSGQRFAVVSAPAGESGVEIRWASPKPETPLRFADASLPATLKNGETARIRFRLPQQKPAVERISLNVLRGDVVMYQEDIAPTGGLVDVIINFPKSVIAGDYSIALLAPDYATVALPGTIKVSTEPRPHSVLGSSAALSLCEFDEQQSEVNGVRILKSWKIACEHNYENKAEVDRGQLTLSAVMGEGKMYGYAFAGMEMEGMRRVGLKLRRRNNFANLRFRLRHSCALYVDYHTPKGYMKRFVIQFPIDSRNRRAASGLKAVTRPFWGTYANSRNNPTGRMIFETVRKPDVWFDYTLDLEKHAPMEWDGRFVLGAGVNCAGHGAGLDARIVPAQCVFGQGVSKAKRKGKGISGDRKPVFAWQNCQVFEQQTAGTGRFDRRTMTLAVSPKSGQAGLLAEGLCYLETQVVNASAKQAGWCGMVLDYEVNGVWAKRVYLHLAGAIPKQADIVTPWSCKRARNIEVVDLSGKVKAGQDRILIETKKYAPPDWAGVSYLTLAGRNATVDLKLLENETFLRF